MIRLGHLPFRFGHRHALFEAVLTNSSSGRSGVQRRKAHHAEGVDMSEETEPGVMGATVGNYQRGLDVMARLWGHEVANDMRSFWPGQSTRMLELTAFARARGSSWRGRARRAAPHARPQDPQPYLPGVGGGLGAGRPDTSPHARGASKRSHTGRGGRDDYPADDLCRLPGRVAGHGDRQSGYRGAPDSPHRVAVSQDLSPRRHQGATRP